MNCKGIHAKRNNLYGYTCKQQICEGIGVISDIHEGICVNSEFCSVYM